MQFLKTVFWVLVAVVAVLFASWNWHPVTVNLWANLQADIKLPVLLLIAFWSQSSRCCSRAGTGIRLP